MSGESLSGRTSCHTFQGRAFLGMGYSVILQCRDFSFSVGTPAFVSYIRKLHDVIAVYFYELDRRGNGFFALVRVQMYLYEREKGKYALV